MLFLSKVEADRFMGMVPGAKEKSEPMVAFPDEFRRLVKALNLDHKFLREFKDHEEVPIVNPTLNPTLLARLRAEAMPIEDDGDDSYFPDDAQDEAIFGISWGKVRNRGVVCTARIRYSRQQCVLLAGSQLRKNPPIEALQSYGPKVAEILSGPNIDQHDDDTPYCTVLRDMPIQSHALAYTVVKGHIGNAQADGGWKNANGKTIREVFPDNGDNKKKVIVCHHCGSDLDTFQYGVNHYCMDCGHRIGNAAKAALAALRKSRNPYEYYETTLPALEDLAVLLAKPEISAILPKSASILEPTDGNGVVGSFLRKLGYIVESSDIAPQPSSGIRQMDFFDYDGSVQYDAIIFNPPFGAVKKGVTWLKHSFKQARFVIALLPQRFQNNKKVYGRFRKHLYAMLPTDYLVFPSCYSLKSDGRPDKLSMACYWYVWDRERNSDTASYFTYSRS